MGSSKNSFVLEIKGLGRVWVWRARDGGKGWVSKNRSVSAILASYSNDYTLNLQVRHQEKLHFQDQLPDLENVINNLI